MTDRLATIESPKITSDRAFGARDIWPLLEEYRFLKETYGLRVKAGDKGTSDPDYLVTFPLGYLETLRAVEIFKTALSKYPPSYIQGLNIERIRLSRRLDEIISQNPNKVRSLAGLCTQDHQLYFKFNIYSQFFVENITHHELQHQADEVEANECSSVEATIVTSERYWEKLNKASPYIGEAVWDEDYDHYDPEEGFARRYGRKNKNEDRATVAELLMSDPQKARRQCDTDPVFEKKIHQIMRDYKRRSRGLMNGQYFNDLLNGKVGPNYWL